MTLHTNDLGQPVGQPVPNWAPVERPSNEPLLGRFCRIERFDLERHASDLHAANATAKDAANWTYLPYGPFASEADYRAWAANTCLGADPLFYAIVDSASGRSIGLASYLRIDPAHGVIEVGHINYSPLLQRAAAATEAMYLMMQRVFALGYRRYEWKCNALNIPSRLAAQRLGFSFEGVFRQAVISKGRNRDTAWYAMIDAEWPALDDAFQQWLAPANFDAQGRQHVRLSALTAPLLFARG